ncbi:B3 domain-containing protein Os06g0194400-like [Rhodamnia argentea]|uniref:B3 domain-containing protein Os06g0194400-like n=1 Tax=Rhodamnia argentea TaxID=178133 RepID=A0A8B8NR59_9MYRT|nr:B3 domain-containing protein Os06g0194400-like [Rhodamnia argentea]
MGKMDGGSKKRDYEECRRQRMEENKKRMEELRLNKLAAALVPTSPKSTPVKQSKMRTPRKQSEPSSVPVRRSGRTANKPAPNYKDVLEIGPLERVRRSYSRRDLSNRVYASDAIRAYAIERAEQLQSSLDAEFPSFIKPMLQSHVTGGFWLSLQHDFCRKHLPHRDDTVTLVDEDGEEFETKYLIEKNGLSGGWRGFSIAHDLVDGDALVFQLIEPLTFKVHIIRAYESEEKEAEVTEEEEAKDPEKKKAAEGHKEVEREADVPYLTRSAKRIRASRK